MIQKMLAHHMRRFAQRVTNADIDARLPKINRHQLCMAVSEMHKRQIAKSGHIVLNPRICKDAAIDCHTGSTGHCQQAHEFPAVKTHLDTSNS